MTETVYSVRTFNEHRPVASIDSCIATIPPAIFADDGTIDARLFGRALRMVSNECAANIHETLHHADWVITTDPDVIETIGMHGQPDCARCRASVDQALAAVNDHPEGLLVGALYWAAS